MSTSFARQLTARLRFRLLELQRENEVNLLDATFFGYAAWRIYLTAGLVLLYFALKFHWSREAARESAVTSQTEGADPVAAPKLGLARAGRTASLTDTQRIDQLFRRVSLKPGEQADLKDLTFGRLPQLQVQFAGIELASGREFARIKLHLGGAEADCGNAVEQVGTNDFLVPRGAHNDQHCAVHYTCGKSDAVSFLEFKVAQIDAVKQTAAIDVMHVRGRRAA